MKAFVWIIVFILGCKSSDPQGRRYLKDACKELESKINTLWKYDPDKCYHVGNGFFLDSLTLNSGKYQDCMENKDTAYIVKLFGKHFRAESNPEVDKFPHKLIYMTSKYPCLGRGSDYHCSYLIFYFDDKSKIRQLNYVDMQQSTVN